MDLQHLTVMNDSDAVSWFVARMHPEYATIGGQMVKRPCVGSLLLPWGFPSYARILHPPTLGDNETPVRWEDVARANGKPVQPLMQWPTITQVADSVRVAEELWSEPPLQGSLPSRIATVLVELLAPHTATPERCWFGLWDGYGTALVEPLHGAPTAVTPMGDMIVLRGPLSAAAGSLMEAPFEQIPNLWWSEDRTWFVASDPDLVSTYVAGSQALIADLFRETRLEMVPSREGDDVSREADRQ